MDGWTANKYWFVYSAIHYAIVMKKWANMLLKFLWHILNAWFLRYMSHKTHLIQLGS